MNASPPHNLLGSVHVATVFVDPQLNVKRFTAPAKKVFRLRDSDVGRPVSDLVVNLDYQTLVEDAQEVLRTLVFAEREVQTMRAERGGTRSSTRREGDVQGGAARRGRRHRASDEAWAARGRSRRVASES